MDIPSLFMIPSAVSSGKVHSVFPNSTDADFDFNRDSSATRVNSQGLIETVGYFGSELITNGGFDSAAGWTAQNTWVISNGVASSTSPNAGGSLYQQPTLTASKIYRVTYTISSFVSGSIRCRVGDNFGVTRTSVGTFIEEITHTTGTRVGVQTLGDFVGSIDNVSVVEVTGDRARLNYEIEGGLVNTKPSLLLELQSTNLITYSEDFNNGWSVNQTTRVANAGVCPDGTNNALNLIANVASSVHLLSATASTTNQRTMSIFAKQNGYTRFRFNTGSSGNGFASFNLANGTVAVTGGTFFNNAKIESLPNDWYRCSMTMNSGGGTTVTIAMEDDAGNVTFTGDGTNGILLWGGMLEEQSYATSYIPTNGSTQTRAAETCNGAGTSSILPSEEGILYIDMTGLADDGTARTFSINNTVSNRVFIQLRSTTGQVNSGVVVSGSLQGSSLSHNISQTSNIKAAFRYKSSDYKFYVNGSQVASQSSGNTFSAGTLNDISFDSGDGAEDFYGKIRDIRVYNTKEMTDSEVDILLTKITS